MLNPIYFSLNYAFKVKDIQAIGCFVLFFSTLWLLKRNQRIIFMVKERLYIGGSIIFKEAQGSINWHRVLPLVSLLVNLKHQLQVLTFPHVTGPQKGHPVLLGNGPRWETSKTERGKHAGGGTPMIPERMALLNQLHICK